MSSTPPPPSSSASASLPRRSSAPSRSQQKFSRRRSRNDVNDDFYGNIETSDDENEYHQQQHHPQKNQSTKRSDSAFRRNQKKNNQSNTNSSFDSSEIHNNDNSHKNNRNNYNNGKNSFQKNYKSNSNYNNKKRRKSKVHLCEAAEKIIDEMVEYKLINDYEQIDDSHRNYLRELPPDRQVSVLQTLMQKVRNGSLKNAGYYLHAMIKRNFRDAIQSGQINVRTNTDRTNYLNSYDSCENYMNSRNNSKLLETPEMNLRKISNGDLPNNQSSTPASTILLINNNSEENEDKKDLLYTEKWHKDAIPIYMECCHKQCNTQCYLFDPPEGDLSEMKNPKCKYCSHSWAFHKIRYIRRSNLEKVYSILQKSQKNEINDSNNQNVISSDSGRQMESSNFSDHHTEQSTILKQSVNSNENTSNIDEVDDLNGVYDMSNSDSDSEKEDGLDELNQKQNKDKPVHNDITNDDDDDIDRIIDEFISANSEANGVSSENKDVTYNSETVNDHQNIGAKSIHTRPTTVNEQCPVMLRQAINKNLNIYQRFLLDVYVSSQDLNWQDLSVDLIKELKGCKYSETLEKVIKLIERKISKSNDNLTVRRYKKSRNSNKGSLLSTIKIIDGDDQNDSDLKHRIPLFLAKVYEDKVELIGPVLDQTNRVARQYGSDRLLRVAFDCSDLRIPAVERYTKIYKRVLDEGLMVAGRKYEFLAFSSSGLRDHKAYFFATCGCDIESITTYEVRCWMGDFLAISNLGKYSARLGQSFSRATPTVIIKQEQMKEIEDVEKNGFCFSDGCGEIAFNIAKEVAESLGYSTDLDEDIPSVYQIRLGSLKGVLAVNHSIKDLILYRPSMKKFEIAKPTPSQLTIEVIKTSKSGTHCGSLNRQYITILSALGAKDEYFLKLQERHLQHLSMMLDNDKKAIRFLQIYASSDDDTLGKRILEHLLAHHDMNEPYIRRQLEAIQRQAFLSLRNKAKIPVGSSRVFFGICDQLSNGKKNLKYGEVYVRVDLGEAKGSTTITGKVVIGKNPCVHPGDLRVLQAVDRPELSHLHNCIVFPLDGERPHPNEIAGSDLDGDTYWICWDPELVEDLTSTEPGDYSEVEGTKKVPFDTSLPPEKLDALKIDHCKDYFVNYIHTNKLGIIANMHCAFADKFGVKDELCLELANFHSRAVDAAKTGDKFILPQYFDDMAAKIGRPHYMKEDKEIEDTRKSNFYQSNKILGKLYDQVIEYEKKTIENQQNANPSKVSMDQDLLLDGRFEYMAEAEMVFGQYLKDMASAMEKFKFDDEGKKVAVEKIKLKYVMKFGEDQSLSEEQLLRKASAWYEATYKSSMGRGYDSDKSPLSFPWVTVSEYLNRIKADVMAKKYGKKMSVTIAPSQFSKLFS